MRSISSPFNRGVVKSIMGTCNVLPLDVLITECQARSHPGLSRPSSRFNQQRSTNRAEIEKGQRSSNGDCGSYLYWENVNTKFASNMSRSFPTISSGCSHVTESVTDRYQRDFDMSAMQTDQSYRRRSRQSCELYSQTPRRRTCPRDIGRHKRPNGEAQSCLAIWIPLENDDPFLYRARDKQISL